MKSIYFHRTLLIGLLLTILKFPYSWTIIVLSALYVLFLIFFEDSYLDKKRKKKMMYCTGILFSLKKIHSDIGSFYIRISSNTGDVCVYKDNFFYLEEIGKIYNHDYIDREQLSAEISELLLKSHFHKEKSMRQKIKEKKMEIYTNWNGSLTKQLDRDQKIDKVV